jgi:hypothetical protein
MRRGNLLVPQRLQLPPVDMNLRASRVLLPVFGAAYGKGPNIQHCRSLIMMINP